MRATVKVVARDGLRGFTYRAVAREAGVTNALIAHHFGSARGLLRATLEMAKSATGQPIGGVAPLGHPTNLPTYIDTALEQYPELWAAAGHPNTVFRTTYSELLRITAGLAVDMD